MVNLENGQKFHGVAEGYLGERALRLDDISGTVAGSQSRCRGISGRTSIETILIWVYPAEVVEGYLGE